VIVLYASRVVAREDTAGAALLICAPMIVIAAFLAPLIYPKPNQFPHHRHLDAARPRSRHHGASARH
jgi:hypothetical protein